MKYIKHYESYRIVEETMRQLRTVAKMIFQKLPAISREQGAQLIIDDNYHIVFKRVSKSENIIAFIEVEVYHDAKHIGNINFDFKSEAPHILVAYDMDSVNERIYYL